MSVKQITKQEAIEAVKGIFNVLPFDERENRKSFFSEKDGNVAFFIDKNEHERYDVIAKLQEYFADKNIEDGQCRIDGITLLFTTVHIENRNNHE